MGNLGAAGIGPIGFGVIGALALLAAVSAVVARQPVDVHRLPVVGVVARLPARLDLLAEWLRARFPVSGVAVAVGAAGLLVVGALAVGFTVLLDDVLEGEGFARLDDPVAHWLAGRREAWLTVCLLGVTRLGNADAQTVWLVLVCLLAAVRSRSWLPAAVGAAGGGGIALVIVVAKRLVGRHRPTLPDAVIAEHGFSFPSGHATGAAAIGLLGAWMLCHWVVRPWGARVAVWAATIAMVGLIGFSRCYLGVHFVTDVLAGWLLGAAWAGTVILLTAWWSRRTANR